MSRPASRMMGFAIIGLGMTVSPVSGHEFWIDPQDFMVSPGEEIRADIRIGQDFKGDAFPYIPSRFAAFKRHDGEGEADVAGTTGDLPALTLAARAEGLTIVTYVSIAERIRFFRPGRSLPNISTTRAWLRSPPATTPAGCRATRSASFTRAAPRPFSPWAMLRAKRTAPPACGSNSWHRRTRRRSRPARRSAFTLLWEGAPLADTQVALFRRTEDGGDAARIVTRTDGNGHASFSLPAPGAYLASAVHMIEAPTERNADWESYWASLTFGVE